MTNPTLERTRLPASPDVEAVLAQEQKLVTPKRVFWVVLAIAVLVYTGIESDLSFGELFAGSGNMVEYIGRYFPPDFSNWRLYLADTLETIAMGIWGTLMAAIVAVPLSILSSENLCPYWVVFIVRRFNDAMRAINEIVFALIFVVAVGLGPFAGVLALFVHTAGTLGKLFSEAIEAIDPGPVEGIRATGASRLQEIVFGVLPQVMPLWTSFVLYRFESNVRSASVLGIVGAGGIGVSLYQTFRAFRYQDVCAILIILIVAVSIIDTLSSTIRNRLV
ncbi:MAG: phosphonate ABC transporter, permease protein PhnE [Synechococcales bacterium]|nr:phosphonate ABC transporter, permease protein PhnE [Synechococcales bacterium]